MTSRRSLSPMARAKPMKRGYIARKPRKRRVKGAPKMLGKSAVVKGPARDPKHLERVRAEKCLGCYNTPSAQSHHAREMVPRTMGRRVSDYLTVPLCHFHHQDPFFGVHGLHGGMAFWDRIGVDPSAWIARFSPEGAAEIARLNGARAKPSAVNEDHHA